MANADFKDRLLECLGGDWPASSPLNPQTIESSQADEFRLEKITYEVEPGDRVPAYLLIPDGVSAAHTAAAVCIWHQHAGQWHLGKSEPAGLAGNPMHHTGAALAREGYVVLCPDAWGFEEREKGYRLKGRNLERFLFLQQVVAGRYGRTFLICAAPLTTSSADRKSTPLASVATAIRWGQLIRGWSARGNPD